MKKKSLLGRGDRGEDWRNRPRRNSSNRREGERGDNRAATAAWWVAHLTERRWRRLRARRAGDSEDGSSSVMPCPLLCNSLRTVAVTVKSGGGVTGSGGRTGVHFWTGSSWWWLIPFGTARAVSFPPSAPVWLRSLTGTERCSGRAHSLGADALHCCARPSHLTTCPALCTRLAEIDRMVEPLAQLQRATQPHSQCGGGLAGGGGVGITTRSGLVLGGGMGGHTHIGGQRHDVQQPGVGGWHSLLGGAAYPHLLHSPPAGHSQGCSHMPSHPQARTHARTHARARARTHTHK